MGELMGLHDDNDQPLSEESVAVQAHLQILQGVIQRMAINSTSCKAWCITIVSAILVLISDKGNPDLAWIALLPSFLFLALDAYYLAMERAFRASYNAFVSKLHTGKIHVEDVYSVIPKGGITKHQLYALKSFSVWGFYSGIAVLVALTKWVILT
jgi:hypothetical protein